MFWWSAYHYNCKKKLSPIELYTLRANRYQYISMFNWICDFIKFCTLVLVKVRPLNFCHMHVKRYFPELVKLYSEYPKICKFNKNHKLKIFASRIFLSYEMGGGVKIVYHASIITFQRYRMKFKSKLVCCGHHETFFNVNLIF